MSATETLDNGRVRLALEHGRLVALGHDQLGVELVGEPRLADGWRLLVELPGGVTTVRGAEQPAPRVEHGAGGAALTLCWDALATPDGEVAIAVRQELALDGDTLTARLHVENASGLLVEEAYPLCIGGMADWERQDAWRMCVPSIIFGGQEWSFYREFPGGYLGGTRPAFAFGYPGVSVDYWQQNLSMSYVSLYDAEREVGVYLANHNPEVAFSALWGELAPSADFAAPAGRSGPMAWPHPARARGDVPIGATLGWAFFPLLREGAYESPPVVVRFHRGGWYEATRHYRAWFEREVAPVPPARRDGLARHDAWQNTYMESPGGRPRFGFADLPRIAQDALDAGIGVIHIGGYHEGGLDTSYPWFARPSSRLGGPDAMRAGIAAARERGVDVLLFANSNQLSLDAPDYEETLARFAIQRPDGQPHLPLGFGFDRLLSVMGFTVPRMVAGNLAHPELRALLTEEWERVLALGADAIQIDKLISGEPFHLDFNPAVEGSPTSSAHASLIATVRDFATGLEDRDPRPSVALETGWDRLLPYGEVTYTRYFGQDHVPVREVAFPEVKTTCCVCGEFDYGLVNNCIRYGHVIALEGAYLWGTAADVPDIVPYIREVLRLRRSLMQNLWWATLVAPGFAAVEADGPIRVGAFESWDEQPESGTRHALVLHHFEPEPMDVRVALAAPYARAAVHRPFAEPELVDAPARLTIARDEVVVLLPLPASS
jgi:hypothetical protein